MKIDLSCDLGEAITPDELRSEAEIWPLVTSANIACGGHVGDESSMTRAVAEALRCRVQLGAHPSYPDRPNFGRASSSISPRDLVASLVEQLNLLRAIAAKQGGKLRHVKAHGALYNDAHHDRARATSIVDAVSAVDGSMELVCASGSQVEVVARERGVPLVLEAFADRRYRPDGTLQPRKEAGSLLETNDDAVTQALLLAREQRVIASDGTSVTIPFATLCLHGDMGGAVERIRAVRAALAAVGADLTCEARS